MSLSLRTNRMRCYAYTDADADVTGNEDAVYVLQGEFWAAYRPAGSSERTVSDKAEHVSTDVFLFSQAATIPVTGLLKNLVTGEMYKITAVQRRGRDELQVYTVSTDDQEYTLFDLISGSVVAFGAGSTLASSSILSGQVIAFGFGSAGPDTGQVLAAPFGPAFNSGVGSGLLTGTLIIPSTGIVAAGSGIAGPDTGALVIAGSVQASGSGSTQALGTGAAVTGTAQAYGGGAANAVAVETISGPVANSAIGSTVVTGQQTFQTGIAQNSGVGSAGPNSGGETMSGPIVNSGVGRGFATGSEIIIVSSVFGTGVGSGFASAPSSALGPNAPAGWTVVVNYTGQTAPPVHPPGNTTMAGGAQGLESFVQVTGGTPVLVTDLTVPQNGPKALSLPFPAGSGAGGAPVIMDQEDVSGAPPFGATNGGRIYNRAIIASSSNWTNSTNVGTKTMFFRSPFFGNPNGTNHYWSFLNGSGSNTDIILGLQWGNGAATNYLPNVGSAHNYCANGYHDHEIILQAETVAGTSGDGIYQHWVDNVLRANYANVTYFRAGQTPQWDSGAWVPTYGGGPATVPALQNLLLCQWTVARP